MKKVYAALCAALLFASVGAGAGAFAQNVKITVRRAESKIYAGFRERIYVDGKSQLTLTNGASGEISVSGGEHTIHAELYTLTTPKVLFNARSGLTFVVTPHSLDNFVIEQEGARLAAPARAAGEALQTFEEELDTGVEGTLLRAANSIMGKLSSKSKIAIVYVTSRDEEVTEFIAGELEFIMVDKGFTLIDRSQLDKIRKEQALQFSGEVDDAQAVSIGKLAGANVIITGAITGSGDLRRLRLRALDTQSAQVLAVTSERY